MKIRTVSCFVAASFIALTGTAAIASPVISINGSDLDPAVLGCGTTGNQTTCTGTSFTGSGFALTNFSFVFDSDPSVTVNYTLTNLSSTTQPFTLTASFPVAPFGPSVRAFGSDGPSVLTDANGGGATLTDFGAAMYQALIDGTSVQTLRDPAQFFNIPITATGAPGPPLSIPAVSFGPIVLPLAVTSSISVRNEFTLTAGDQYENHMSFAVDPVPAVPEPASLLQLGLGLTGLILARRRRSA